MGHRLSKIYTRTGDNGYTGLTTGVRVAKSSLRIALIGDIDELNSSLGTLRATLKQTKITQPNEMTTDITLNWEQKLSHIQHQLFDLGGEFSMPGQLIFQLETVQNIEAQIDQMNEHLPSLKEFILPAGELATTLCHQSRALCRRVERAAWLLQEAESNLNPNSLLYLNRLSDWLFVAARFIQRQLGGEEIYWQKQYQIGASSSE